MDALNRIKFLEDRLHRLSEIGMALSTEKDTNVLFEMILDEAKNITNADGGHCTQKIRKETLTLRFCAQIQPIL